VTLTFDVPGQSVRCRWLHGEAVLVDIFREGARRLSVYSGRGEARVVTAFETAGLVGELAIHLLPEVRIVDQLLFA
jgi:hypothetical protein